MQIMGKERSQGRLRPLLRMQLESRVLRHRRRGRINNSIWDLINCKTIGYLSGDINWIYKPGMSEAGNRNSERSD